jgi:hypothetical protein
MRTIRIWITVLYAFSMVLVGFAHAALPLAEPGKSVDLSSYVLPDGSLPSLCLTGSGGGDSHAKSNLCDACLLTASPGLLHGATVSETLPQAVAPALWPPANDVGHAATAGHVPHLRGPPALFSPL